MLKLLLRLEQLSWICELRLELDALEVELCTDGCSLRLCLHLCELRPQQRVGPCARVTALNEVWLLNWADEAAPLMGLLPAAAAAQGPSRANEAQTLRLEGRVITPEADHA